MSVGEKIKAIRLAKGLSQKQLGILCGLSEPTIRLYELGLRHPNQEKLGRISKELGVSLSVFKDWNIETRTDAMQVLFVLCERFGLEVSEDSKGLGGAALSFTDMRMQYLLSEWRKKQDAFQQGEISKEELSAWMMNFDEFELDKWADALRSDNNP